LIFYFSRLRLFFGGVSFLVCLSIGFLFSCESSGRLFFSASLCFGGVSFSVAFHWYSVSGLSFL